LQREKYNCLIAEWLAAGRQIPRESAEITIGEVLNAYRKFAETYYRRPDGTPTGEFDRVRRELKPLRLLYGAHPLSSSDHSS
jgi:hypothetical protein